MNHKKLKKNYRIRPLVDSLIVLGARESGHSQADFIEFCVMTQAREVINMIRSARILVTMDPLPKELSAALSCARQEFVRMVLRERENSQTPS
jgi:hypothetical protein